MARKRKTQKINTSYMLLGLAAIAIVAGAFFVLNEGPTGFAISGNGEEEVTPVTSATLEIMSSGQDSNTIMNPRVMISNTGTTEIHPRINMNLLWSELQSSASMKKIGGGGDLEFASNGELIQTIQSGQSISGEVRYSRDSLRVGNYKLELTLTSDGEILDSEVVMFRVELIS
jgi:hypothetical protein